MAKVIGSDTSTDIETGVDRRADPAGILATMSRLPGRDRHRLRFVTVATGSLGVIGYAAVSYLGFDPSGSHVGLRADVPLHFPILMAHILTAMVALALGPLQFVRRIRRVPRLHRYLGRTYLFAGVFPSSLVAIPTALLSTSGPVASAGLIVGDIAWFVTALAAYRAVRAHRFRDHATWMIRNFALTFAAVTFRLWLPLLILVQLPFLHSRYGGDFGPLFHTAYLTTTWLAFLPNLVVVNLYLRRARRPGDRLPRNLGPNP